MLKKALACAVFVALTGCNDTTNNATTAESSSVSIPNIKVTYPTTVKNEVVDQYFETKVTDPYRWLEDDMSAQTAQWVKDQNKVTFDYLANIPYRDKLKERLAALMNYEKVGAPFTEGEYSYFYKNDGLQNQYVVYRQLEGGEVEERC